VSEAEETRECPYCKEEIKAEAVKCKHCGSRVTPERPPHEGVCPYCKEEIHPEAIKCKHCRSSLVASSGEALGDSGCGCEDSADPSSALGGFRALGEWPSAQPEGPGSGVTWMASKRCGSCEGETMIGSRGTWGSTGIGGTRTCQIMVCAYDPLTKRTICAPAITFTEDCSTVIAPGIL
jgi:hypothetical protein